MILNNFPNLKLDKLKNYNTLSKRDQLIFEIFYCHLILKGELTQSNLELVGMINNDSNYILSGLRPINNNILKKILAKYEELKLITRKSTREYNQYKQTYKTVSRSITLNFSTFPWLSKQNVFTMEEHIQKAYAHFIQASEIKKSLDNIVVTTIVDDDE